MAPSRKESDSIRSPTELYGSLRSTPSEWSDWGTYPDTTRFRNWQPGQAGPSASFCTITNHAAPGNVAGPSNLQPRHISISEDSDQESAGGQAAIDVREKINSTIVVGGKQVLNPRQKWARKKMFDLEMSEAKGGMIFDYEDEASMIVDLLCRIHDCREIQREDGPTLIVVPNDKQIEKWKSAAQEFSDGFLNQILDYHGRRRSAVAPFNQYKIVITTYRTLSGDLPLVDRGLLQNGLRFLRVILDGGDVIRNRTTQQSGACRGVNAVYHWVCAPSTQAIPPNQYEAFAEFLRIPNLNAARRKKEFLDRFILPQNGDDAEVELPTSELEGRSLVFQKVDLDHRERRFYRALEKRLDHVGGQYLRPRALRNGGADIVRRMLLFSLEACCHLGLVLRDRGRIRNNDDDVRCNLCRERIEPEDDPQFCASCHEEVLSSFPSDRYPYHSRNANVNPKIKTMLDILRLTTMNRTDGRGKTAILCQFSAFADIIEGHLGRKRVIYEKFHDSNQRQKIAAMERIESHCDPAIALVVVDPANIHGLDLRPIDTVILMDLWWNPRLDARAFVNDHNTRINIYKLYFGDTIESRILNLLNQPQPIEDDQDFIHELGIPSNAYNLDSLLEPH